VATVYLFTRNTSGDHGERLTQAAIVYANDSGAASELLTKELGALRATSGSALYGERPAWEVEERPIREPGVIALFATGWSA